MNPTRYGLRFDTPLGVCQVRASEAGLLSVCFDEAHCALPANALCRDGSLTGYAGGLPRKRALLDLEAVYATA